MKNIGLYIHIPFCNHICSYCDFTKRVSNNFVKEEYFNALINEIEYKKILLKDFTIKTIYIGGGTPSSISIELLEKLFIKLNELVKFDNLLEFTFECNIEDISIELAKFLSKYHVNRISIGIESLNSKILKIIGRTSNLTDIQEKMRILHDFGLKNVNFDYIYAIEPLTIEDTIEDINKLISLKPMHISCYSLILEEKTILYHQYKKGTFKLMDEEKESKMYDAIKNFLNSHGYIQYETSNFSLPSYESKHNIIYWSNEEYLGIGLGSSSYLNNYRFKNIDNLFNYIKYYNSNIDKKNYDIFKDTIIDIEKLDLNESIEYELILGLRMVKGINLNLFKSKYNHSIEYFYPKIPELIKAGYLKIEDEFIKINEKYFYLQNQILLKIID